MKKKRSLLTSVMMLVFILVLSTRASAASSVPAQQLEVTGDDVIVIGKSATYKSIVTPSNATNKGVEWSVSPENSGATINTSGVLKIDASASLDKVTVMATSKDNSNVVARKQIGVNKTAIKSMDLVDADGKSVAGKTINICRNKVTSRTKTSCEVISKITWENPALINKNRAYIFTSSNENIVKVDNNGHVSATGNGIGKATIKCMAVDGTKSNGGVLAKSVVVNVIEPVTNIQITGNNLLATERNTTYKATIAPANASIKTITWKVSPEGKGATINSSGNLKIDKTCDLKTVDVIAVSNSNDEVLSKKTVLINPTAIGSISFKFNDETVSNSTIKLYRQKVNSKTVIGGKLDVNIVKKDSTKDFRTRPYELTSTNTDLVTVDQSGNIQVTGKSTGTAIIKCTAIDGTRNGQGILVKNLTVKVVEPVNKIEISGEDIIAPNVSKTYTAKVLPANGDNKGITWEVSPADCGATINSSGQLKFKSAPSVNEVSVKAVSKENDGVIGTKKVWVNRCAAKSLKLNNPTGKDITSATVQLFRNKPLPETPIDLQIKPAIDWADGTNVSANKVSYLYTSSDVNIALVDANGHVTVAGNKTGTATITCKAYNGGTVLTKTVTVNVQDAIDALEVNVPSDRSVYVAKDKTVKLITTQITDIKNLKKSLAYTSSNPAVATVSSEGVVKMLADSFSKVTITVATKDDSGVKTSIDLYGVNQVKNIQLGYISPSVIGTNSYTTLEVSNKPIAFSLLYNAPDAGTAKAKTVCDDFVVSSNNEVYLEASYSNGVVYLYPKQALPNKNIVVTLKTKDGSGYQAKWNFRITDTANEKALLNSVVEPSDECIQLENSDKTGEEDTADAFDDNKEDDIIDESITEEKIEENNEEENVNEEMEDDN